MLSGGGDISPTEAGTDLKICPLRIYGVLIAKLQTDLRVIIYVGF